MPFEIFKLKTKKAETTKKIEKSVSFETDKNTFKILSEESLNRKCDEESSKEPCEKTSRIFNELMEEKWDGGDQGDVKEERISSFNQNNSDEKVNEERSNSYMNKRYSKESSLIKNKNSEHKLMKTSDDVLDEDDKGT